MALVVFHHEFIFLVMAFQGLLHDLGVSNVDARVTQAVGHEHRCLDAVSVIAGRPLLQELLFFLGIADQLLHLVQPRSPRIRCGLEQQRDIRHAHVVDAALVQLGRKGEPRHGGIPAIAGAINTDPVAVGDALFDSPLEGVGDVRLHGLAPLFTAGQPMFHAKTGRAAKIHLQHGIPPACEKLQCGVVAPAVAGPRPAMGMHDGRQVLAVGAWRQGQVTLEHEAVPCLDLERPRLGHFFRLDPRAGFRQVAKFPLVEIVQVVHGRLGRGESRDDADGLRLVGAAHGVDGIGQCLVDAGHRRFPGRVHINGLRLVHHEVHSHDVLGFLGGAY